MNRYLFEMMLRLINEQLDVLQSLKEQGLSEATLAAKGGLVKYKTRLQLFRDRLEENKAFATLDGNSFLFGETDETDALKNYLDQLIKVYDKNPIKSAADERYKKLKRLIKAAGTTLNVLLKDEEFGAANPLSAEQRQITEIEEAIKAACKENGTSSILINVGRTEPVEIDGVKKVEGTPKADCVLTFNGEEISYISLKSAANAKDMMQWAGITNSKDPEVIKFAADFYLWNAQPRRDDQETPSPFYRELETNLQQYVYGKDWENIEPSQDNCDLVLATREEISLSGTSPPEGGDADLSTEIPTIYNFVSTNIFYKPQVPEGGWKPTLWGRFASQRNNFGLKQIRLSVSPREYRKNANPLPEFSSILNLNVPSEDIFDVAASGKEQIQIMSLQDVDPEEIERAQQSLGRPSLEEQIEIIDTEET